MTLARSDNIDSVLFVCTGNIFRSMTAEYALRNYMGPSAAVRIGSAGTEARSQGAHPFLLKVLAARGVDASSHIQRRFGPHLVSPSTLVIAMGIEHQKFIAQHFGQQVPLFNSLVHGEATSVKDLFEVVPDWETNHVAAAAYIEEAVAHIFAGVRALPI